MTPRDETFVTARIGIEERARTLFNRIMTVKGVEQLVGPDAAGIGLERGNLETDVRHYLQESHWKVVVVGGTDYHFAHQVQGDVHTLRFESEPGFLASVVATEALTKPEFHQLRQVDWVNSVTLRLSRGAG